MALKTFEIEFKDLAKETGISYQNLMNSYLTECAHKHVKPELKWA